MSTKRKRVVLKLEDKIKITDRIQEGEAVNKLAYEYGIARQTVRDICKKRDELLEFFSTSPAVCFASGRKTLKRSPLQELDKLVYSWFQQQSDVVGVTVTGPQIIEKAKCFHEQLNIITPFAGSTGWLTNFKKRHGIRFNGEKLNNDEITEKCLQDVSTKLEYIPESCFQNIMNFCDVSNIDKSSNQCFESSSEEKTIPVIKETNEMITLSETNNTSSINPLKMSNLNDINKSSDKVESLLLDIEIDPIQALQAANTLLEFLEQQKDTELMDIVNLCKIRASIRHKISTKKRKKQTLMTDYVLSTS